MKMENVFGVRCGLCSEWSSVRIWGGKQKSEFAINVSAKLTKADLGVWLMDGQHIVGDEVSDVSESRHWLVTGGHLKLKNGGESLGQIDGEQPLVQLTHGIGGDGVQSHDIRRPLVNELAPQSDFLAICLVH